jgi:glutamine---fructose-6-phosphate transaminase (isomerizing)
VTTRDTQLEREITAVLRRLLQEERANIEKLAAAIRERDPRYVMLAARGSSDNAGRYAQYLFGAANRLPVALATPSLFTLYQTPPRLDSALVLAISQSGQSPDIISVIDEGRRQGALTVAVTNDVNSPLAQAAEFTINMHAEKEKAVAATKTYTASLMSIAMLSAALGSDSSAWAALESVPVSMERIVADESIENTLHAAERYRYMEACVVLSRGYNYATCYEVALKLKELTYILAEPYSSADFKHGPVALVAQGFPVLAIVPEGKMDGELVEFMRELRRRGAELAVISAREDALSPDIAQTPLPIPGGIPEWVSPMVAVVRGQLFAYGLTLAKGYNPDTPRGITKVTLTE